MEKEKIEFNGVVFVRYPNAKRPTDRKYFRAQISLHREIWKKTHGVIPKGHDIHHVDGDYNNNSIENLECLTREQHFSKHSALSKINPDKDKYKNSRMWHKTQEAFEWHSITAKNSWKHRKKITVKCLQCNKSHQSHSTSSTKNNFCSGYCSTKYRRLSGIDDVTSNCAICDKKINYNKYKPKVTCGKICQALKRKKTLLQGIVDGFI